MAVSAFSCMKRTGWDRSLTFLPSSPSSSPVSEPLPPVQHFVQRPISWLLELPCRKFDSLNRKGSEHGHQGGGGHFLEGDWLILQSAGLAINLHSDSYYFLRLMALWSWEKSLNHAELHYILLIKLGYHLCPVNFLRVKQNSRDGTSMTLFSTDTRVPGKMPTRRRHSMISAKLRQAL